MKATLLRLAALQHQAGRSNVDTQNQSELLRLHFFHPHFLDSASPHFPSAQTKEANASPRAP